MESSEIPNFFRDVAYRCRVIRTFGKRKPGQEGISVAKSEPNLQPWDDPRNDGVLENSPTTGY
uniref:Uncharacterized protein n=1 Tax=Oryza meridionalis TaxID=40149 RepID=A0A0E0DEV0_9ORYZ